MKNRQLILLTLPYTLAFGCVVTSADDDDDTTMGSTTGMEMTTTGTDTNPFETDSTDTTEGGESGEGEGEESGGSGGEGGVSQCDPWAEDDCGEGFKCAPYDEAPIELVWDSNGCFEVAENPGVPGDDCSVFDSAVDGIDDCDATSMCMPSDFDNLDEGGSCIAFCEGSMDSPSCADPGSTCVTANDGVLNLCLEACDPTMSGACPEGEGCYLNPTDGKFFCFTQDEEAADAESGYGAPCGTLNYCDPGLQCDEGFKVPDCDEYCCTEYCDTQESDEQCSGFDEGQECVPVYEDGEAPAGFEHVGLCALPQQ